MVALGSPHTQVSIRKKEVNMWKRYRVVLQVTGPFGGSLPKTKEEIQAMLEHRMPGKKPTDAIPIEELAEQVVAEVRSEEEEEEAPLPGWSTFKRDDKGLYYEGRSIRGHLKDCATQIAVFYPAIKAFKAKLANKVYVETDKIYVGKAEPDGTQQRYIQVMTPQGPRSSYKFIDYVLDPRLEFELLVLDDGRVDEDILRNVFEYGGVHGTGAERSQGWGRYKLVELAVVE